MFYYNPIRGGLYMNRISEITKRDILNLFKDGFYIDEVFGVKGNYFPYHGLIEEIEFLQRLYNLKSMPSLDPRFSNAKEDIWQHTVNNNDYPYCWVFEDDRFQLENGDDEKYLRFICEVFHPAVRDDSKPWKVLLTEINKLLRNDGYELYPAIKISNRDVYNWRVHEPEDSIFIPFSMRNKKAIEQKKIKLKIKRDARYQIYQIFEKFNYIIYETDETNFQYNVLVSEKVLEEISRFYPPKCFNNKKQYVNTNSLQDFILSNYPYCVFDAIEFFNKYCNDEFETEINTIFNLNGISYKLKNGKIESVVDEYVREFSPVSLRYNKRTKNIPETFSPINFGKSKGLTFDRVLIYPNGPIRKFLEGDYEAVSSPKTKAGLYVAITRARYSVTFITDQKVISNKYVEKFTMNNNEIVEV